MVAGRKYRSPGTRHVIKSISLPLFLGLFYDLYILQAGADLWRFATEGYQYVRRRQATAAAGAVSIEESSFPIEES